MQNRAAMARRFQLLEKQARPWWSWEDVASRALFLTSGAAAPKEICLPPTQSKTGRSSGEKQSEGTFQDHLGE